ncbi:hypothetical protein Zmor_009794 [Zophobas morio]|uniref:Acyl-coenzyme A oxidase n=1 Tax=Zophobas morio TaxID=2755281 RepID=A0AA38MJ73_9CUCU|nr:hypothetical protein Zmor_009794 [Zophobas morio]
MSHLLQDLPPGSLDYYRKQASFDWKRMKVFIDTEDGIKFQNNLYKKLQMHPEFLGNPLLQTLDEKRNKATQQALAYASIVKSLTNSEITTIKREDIILRTILQFNPSAAFKYPGIKRLFTSALQNQGTQRHHKFIQLAESGKIYGCFCMTEIGHGSDTKNLRTTVVYDKEKGEFVVNTPDFPAAKCWAGGLAELATHAIVYAQLYINRIHWGLHGFVVPIRNPETLLPYEGVILGDMGEKIGVNGADNGFLIFDKYRFPRENILNRFADVTPEGNYVTSATDLKNVRGAVLGALSIARVTVTAKSEFYGTKALTIAVRYAAVRKQFGPKDEEVSILEYQSMQYRLLPYLAAAYIIRFFSMYLDEVTQEFVKESKERNDPALARRGMEIHVISAGAKPVSGWTFRDAIQECREACGGYGYLKASRIGDIKNDQDSINTYEGENHVLIQQVSNWLLKVCSNVQNGNKISTHLKSADFLSNASKILKNKFNATSVVEVCKVENIIDTYQWLVCYLLRETKRKFDALKQSEGSFWARSNTQIFYCKNLSTAFVQHLFLQRMITVINRSPDANIRNVLLKLFSLYGLYNIEKFLPSLFGGGYVEKPEATNLVHEAVLTLCRDLKNDAVALIDAIAPPDFLLNSILGKSDGRVYQRLQIALIRSSSEASRLKWSSETVGIRSSNSD